MRYCLFLVIGLLVIDVSNVLATRVLLKNGQKYEGDILYETDEVIKIQTALGIAVLNKDQVISVVDDDVIPSKKYRQFDPYNTNNYDAKNPYTSKTGTGYGEYSYTDSATEPSGLAGQLGSFQKDDFEFYKNQIIYLNQQIKIYKEEISNFESEIEALKEKHNKREEMLKAKIKMLEEEKVKKEEILSSTKFPELKPIETTREIEINNAYIKSVKFIVSETMEGFFVGAEYKLYSEFVSVKPNFDVFFFNANGLNIGKDTVEYKYNRLDRGQQETIVRGVPMTIPGSAPVYYFIKLKK